MSGSTEDNRFTLFYEHVDHNKERSGLYDALTKGENDTRQWSYDTDKSNNIVTHLPATNTVFINANIALTDGTSKTFSGDTSPRTIPNLYDALQALSSRISELYDSINAQSANSTADKLLYVTNPTDNEGVKDKTSIIIQPGKDGNNVDSSSISTDVDSNVTTVTIKAGTGNSEISINDGTNGISINGDNNVSINSKNDVSIIGTNGVAINGDTNVSITGKEIIFINDGTNKNIISVNDEGIKFTLSGKDVHLGAIIEAIQELNRRTAFIDSTMTFSEAVDKFDSVDTNSVTPPEDTHHTEDRDGLPAATNGTIGIDIRSISSDKLKTMKIIAYDPDTNETIDITDKNISLNGSPLQNNDNSNTFVTPDTATVIMRGCPYLLP